MAIKINTQTSLCLFLTELKKILPYRLFDEIMKIAIPFEKIEEIRLRCDRYSSLTVDGKNILLEYIIGREDIDRVLAAICNDSLYAYRETINSGYVTLEGGIRVGICGRATVDGGRLLGVYDVSSMNFRIPHSIRMVGEPVCRLLRSGGLSQGVLIYAPPGEGKTTLLCAVAAKMAGGVQPLRVCAVDTRGELSAALFDKRLCIDVLSGYPRGLGIDIATRTMSAELIVCDEIGDVVEAEAIISAQNSGVPFIASAHADSISGLMRRTAILRLHEARVFFAYVGIKRTGNGDFAYDMTRWEEADAILHDSGGVHNCSVRR